MFLALPVMLSHIGQVTVMTADNVMVGHVGKESLAAASFANSVFVIFLVIGIGLSYAITPLTAQADGEEDDNKLMILLKHSILLGVVFGVLLSLIIFFSVDILYFFKQPENVVKLSIPYLSIIALSLFPFLIFQSLRQFVEGLGYTRQSMYITIAANLINILLNYVLIFGKFGSPAMGLNGAGIATLISRIFMLLFIYAFVRLNHRFSRYWKGSSMVRLRWGIFKKMLNLGVPMAFQLIFEVGAFSVTAIMIGWMGSTALAAHQIAINMASITYMAALGIASAATIRVGNQLGMKNYKMLREAVFTCFIMVTAFMALMATLLVFGRHFWPSLYIDNTEVQTVAASLLVVAALFQLSDGIQVVGLGALRGMSDVKRPTLITFVAYWGIGIPLGYWLGFHGGMGPVGIWIGLLLGLTSAAVLLFYRFNQQTKALIQHQKL